MTCVAKRHRRHGLSYRKRRKRRGVALVLALLCLAISASLMANMTATIRLDRNRRASRQQALQTTWLARHGLEIARTRLHENPDYAGGEWQVPIQTQTLATTAKAQNMASSIRVGSVRVTVNREQKETTIQVTAKFPFEQPDQIIKIIAVTIPTSPNTTDS